MQPEIVYARPPLERPWRCGCCYTWNAPKRYRIFSLPESFSCTACGADFFQHHDLDFCLADVTINDISLVPDIMEQHGPECFSYACCQAIRMTYLVDIAFKNRIAADEILRMNPYSMPEMYKRKYSRYLRDTQLPPFIQLPPFHKTIKILDLFWKEGIPLRDGSSYRVGDITFVPRTDYRAICRLLANGEPVVASLLPGASIYWLQYGQFYHCPKFSVRDMEICNAHHSEDPHPCHAVVLAGARTNHETGAKAYYIVNSWRDWCKRNVLSDNPNGDIVTYGVGLIREEDLLSNAIKFWLPGERSSDPMAFRSESGDETISPLNYWLYNGYPMP